MQVFHWTEIDSFSNIRKYVASQSGILNNNPVVHYKTKIKLHGNNAGIQFHRDGTIITQSRKEILSTKNHLDGFAKYVESNSSYFKSLLDRNLKDLVIYGEWVGSGIQSGTAINNIKHRSFAVFAARSMDPKDDLFITDPEALKELLSLTHIDDKSIKNIYVLPWYKDIQIDWSASDKELEEKVAEINSWVLEVEKNDPWVEETFGIKGTGEGLVFYPVSEPHSKYSDYCNLTFKAKGEKHRVLKTKESVQINTEVAKTVSEYVNLVLTEARLEQGANSVKTSDLLYDKSLIGKFINWICSDVQKETQNELKASNLEWEQVRKDVSLKAKEWYLKKIS